jgi:Family of unknown function (DUF6002)
MDCMTAPSRNLILTYYDDLRQLISERVSDPNPVLDPVAFSPGFFLPEIDDVLRRYLAAATARWDTLPAYHSTPLKLLDLTGNPGTNTTKTFASLLIVARAVEFIRRCGEPVLIVTPSSGNKGIALRDAVARAITAGLVSSDQLAVAVVVPSRAAAKLRSDLLSQRADLRPRNPVLVFDGARDEDVKPLARKFVDSYAEQFSRRTGARLWFTLELGNYLIADAARALFEHEISPTARAARPRVHAHAVSSAFGLLGYNLGRDLLEARGAASAADRPGFLLVQHLATPDMVLSWHHGSFSRQGIPRYSFCHATGLYEQSADRRFPFGVHDPAEVLEPTFYSQRPATSPAMNAYLERFGGGGIVVSMHECLERYRSISSLLGGTALRLPADPHDLREWSLVMAFTGVMNAVDRGLLEPGAEVVVHGSGSYAKGDYAPIEAAAVSSVRTPEDMAARLFEPASQPGQRRGRS